MQSRGPVSVTVGGQQYRLVASVPEEDLRRLAGVVETKLRGIVPRGKPVTANHILLAAMAMAHDLEGAAEERKALEARTRDLMRRLLTRIDDVLDDGTQEPHTDAADESVVEVTASAPAKGASPRPDDRRPR